MKLNLKQVVILSWAWYCIQLLFWLCWFCFCGYGFTLLMCDGNKSKEAMQNDAGGAVMAIILCALSLLALIQTSFKYPRKYTRMEMDWTGGPSDWKDRPITYWRNLINKNY